MRENDAAVEAAARLRRYVAKYGKLYPRAWALTAAARAQRGKQLPNWDDWCYCPESILLDHYAELNPSLTHTDHIGHLAALAAWRPGQGIYRIHPDVQDALLTQDFTGTIPAESLIRLPEWCCYVMIDPPRELKPYPVAQGFFVNLDHAVIRPVDGPSKVTMVVRETPLRFINLVLDLKEIEELGPAVTFELTGTLDQAITRSFERAVRAWEGHNRPAEAQFLRDKQKEGEVTIRSFCQPLLQMALYLCADDAEIDGEHRRHKTIRKHGAERLLPADQCNFWEVAYRSGAALHAAKQYLAAHAGDGTHAGPRPHLRKAHWHHYWTGPRATAGATQPTERRLVLKWLGPILVNAKGEAMVIPTIHNV